MNCHYQRLNKILTPHAFKKPSQKVSIEQTWKTTHSYIGTMANKIIQWNIRSMKQNLNELLLLIGSLCPMMICLQETFMKENDNVTICNFASYNYINNSTDRALGGTSILINNKILQCRILLNTNLQAVAHQPLYIHTTTWSDYWHWTGSTVAAAP